MSEPRWLTHYFISGILVASIATALFGQTVVANDKPATDSQASRHWSDEQLGVLRSLTLASLGPVPASPSNSVADNPLAIALGRQLFHDARLSRSGQMSCASCHDPERYFTDGRVQSGGDQFDRGRNTPTIVGAAYQDWFYWDGRRDSLWAQSLIPFESPDEMNSTRVSVLLAAVEDETSASLYQQLFGRPLLVPESVKALSEGAGPLASEPARSHWYRLPVSVRKRLNRQYANLGKSLGAYMRTLLPELSRFDRYVQALLLEDGAGGATAASTLISDQERAGLELFIDDSKTQCLRCHNGGRFTNEGFHNVGSGQFSGEQIDLGRILGIQSVLADEFNCRGPYSDATLAQCNALRFMSRDPHEPLSGAFKTPTLRNVSATAPYFHDGRFATLREVIKHYVSPPITGPESVHELTPLDLDGDQIDALVAFLDMLSEPEQTR
ncbi:MAG: cytochrome-c peroxidase [Burkholderiaceae bacterium]